MSSVDDSANGEEEGESLSDDEKDQEDEDDGEKDDYEVDNTWGPCPYPGCGARKKDRNTFKNHYLTHYYDILDVFSRPWVCPLCKVRKRDRHTLIRHYGFYHRKLYELTDITEEEMSAIMAKAKPSKDVGEILKKVSAKPKTVKQRVQNVEALKEYNENHEDDMFNEPAPNSKSSMKISSLATLLSQDPDSESDNDISVHSARTPVTGEKILIT